MNCPNCGIELPDGTASCPTCGASLMAQPQQPYMSASQPYSAAPAKNNNIGTIIGIVAAVIAIVVVAIVLFANNKNGVYKFTSMTVEGVTYTSDEVSSLLGVEVDATFEIKGDNAVLDGDSLDWNNETYTIKFDGDDFTLESIYETVHGTYDPDEKTLTIEEDGLSMTFTKE